MGAFDIWALNAETWGAYERLIAANNGVYGGCWCLGFHTRELGKGKSAEVRQKAKAALVRAGEAHAALVFDGEDCLGWCQYGSPAELPEIKNKRNYDATLVALPDWRITCFFVGKGLRGRGVAKAALRGALDLIAGSGGGIVEAYPEATAPGHKVPPVAMHGGSLDLFMREGFTQDRRIGKNKWVVRRQVDGV